MSQFVPEAGDLLAAIAKLLDDVLLNVPARQQHEVRVAANLARLIEREVRQGPGEPEPAEPTWEQMVAITRRDLAVAKPGYDHWEHG